MTGKGDFTYLLDWMAGECPFRIDHTWRVKDSGKGEGGRWGEGYREREKKGGDALFRGI